MDPVDVAILVLRLGLVAALYLFLLLILRASRQTLAPTRASSAAPRAAPRPNSVVAARLRLVVLDPGATPLRPGATIDVASGSTFGRADDADVHVHIPDATVSGRHARIALADGRWAVDDLGSTNGTSVNGVRVSGRATISPGDELALGAVRFSVDSGA